MSWNGKWWWVHSHQITHLSVESLKNLNWSYGEYLPPLCDDQKVKEHDTWSLIEQLSVHEEHDEVKSPQVESKPLPISGLKNSKYKDEYAKYLHIDGYDIDENMWEEIPLVDSPPEDPQWKVS